MFSEVLLPRSKTYIDASNAPRMKRNTSNPGKEVKAAEIMHAEPQPKKQKHTQ